jgi:energy-coupling factor transport system permease protein
MFLEYHPDHTFLHRLDIRTKMLGFIILSTVAFMFSNPIYNLFVLICCSWIAVSIHLPLRKLRVLLEPLLPVFILIILFSSFSYSEGSFDHPVSRKVLFTLLPGGYFPCTIGGILLGLSLSLRILIMVIASTILTFSSPIDDFLQVLRILRFSPKVAFIITTGLRFIPTMQKKAVQIMEAQRARGADFQSGGLYKKIKSYIPVMVPMIVESIRMSENLAMAMMNRGFGATKKWTILNEFHPGWRDGVISAGLFLLLTGAVFLKIYSYGRI